MEDERLYLNRILQRIEELSNPYMMVIVIRHMILTRLELLADDV